MAALRRFTRLLRKSELRSKKRPKPSRGTVVPEHLRNYVFTRDDGCLGPRLGFPGECWGPLDPDHVRASGGIGMKSPTEKWNLASLCRGHHVRRAIAEMMEAPGVFREMNPANGWGDYEGAIAYLVWIADTCKRWPLARVEVSR